MEAVTIALAVIAVLVVVVLVRSVRIVPQARAGIVERLGRYHRTLMPGLSVVIPFVDRVKPLIDLREQVVSFPPQPVITSDNLVVGIDTVIYFQVTDAKAAEYEVEDYILAIEQLTVTTLRNVIGGLHLEATLTSRDQINGMLRGVLDEATGKWGIKVNRVEIKAIQPPASIQDSMEKQMRAERDRRAAILTAEGVKQSQILTAEGEKQSAILRAQGSRESQILRAEGEAKAIETVFAAIHAGDADEKLLAYQYLQTLPQIAQGQSSKLWIIPSEVTQAIQGLARGVPGLAASGGSDGGSARPRRGAGTESAGDRPEVREAEEAARAASAEADSASTLPVTPGGVGALTAGADLDERAGAAVEPGAASGGARTAEAGVPEPVASTGPEVAAREARSSGASAGRDPDGSGPQPDLLGPPRVAVRRA